MRDRPLPPPLPPPVPAATVPLQPPPLPPPAAPPAPAPELAASRLQLAGIGRGTKGLLHVLATGETAVIGRHPDCTLVCRTPVDGTELALVSRQHAVVERAANGGWVVYDSGSANGTMLLRGGLPPSVVLEAGVPTALAPGDIIELAGSSDYQFSVELARAPRRAPSAAVEQRTERLIESARASLQVLEDGVAIEAIEVGANGVAIGGPGQPAPAAGVQRLELAGLGPARYGQVTLQRSDAELRVETQRLHRNLEPLEPNSVVTLKDKDLLTTPDAPDLSLLFLDPRHVAARNLSDLLAGTDRMTVGKASSNTCRVVDPSVSRLHAEVWRAGAELFVKDLGSRNGTAIDGRRVFDAERLAPGNVLTLGRVPFVADELCWMPSLPGAQPPASGIDVRFVNVSVDIAGKRRLHGVSLGAGHGELVGLLGPSASGKSTLLKALSGEQRLAGGDIYVNGRALQQARWNWFKSLMGYEGDTYEVGFVQQIDLIQPELTVREVLEYAARHMGLAVEDARRRAREAGDLCNLGPLMDRVALLGNGRMNLSGGQLKRVCVAVEILRKPRILLLDEPTTGQDPKNTDDLMKLFRAVAQQGVTLLMSTHDLRNLVVFDKVAALCLGRLVYYGPPTSFASYFGKATAEEVYDSLPDREERQADAEALAARFRSTDLYRRYCEAGE
jgi:ABC-type multidrug transport system ATPase subunit/pSer/pThr/pTyr-binding forkhead associated (FHA) protein